MRIFSSAFSDLIRSKYMLGLSFLWGCFSLKYKFKGYLIPFLWFCLIDFSLSAEDFYWVGGSGNWTDPMHWSGQPGGKSIGRPPSFLDNVFFDEHSFSDSNQTVIVNTIAECRDMDWTGVVNMPRLTSDGDFNNDLSIYGSLKLSPNMIMDFDRPIFFKASSNGNQINLQGLSLKEDVFFQNSGGWIVYGDFVVSGHAIHFEQGVLSFQSDVICKQFLSRKALSRELYLNDSEIIMEGEAQVVWALNTDNITLVAGNSTLTVKGWGGHFESEGSQKVEYYNVLFQGDNVELHSIDNQPLFNNVVFEGDATIEGSCSFENLIFSAGRDYLISKGDTLHVSDTFEAKGTCEHYISIMGDGGIAYIDALEVKLTNLMVGNITAQGGAVPFLALESLDLGNCDNWNVISPAPKTFKWIGDAGDGLWTTAANWDRECVPTRVDEVIIEGKDFNVTIDVEAECKDLILRGYARLQGVGSLSVFGSFSTSGGVWELAGETRFMGDQIQSIDMHGNTFLGDVIFEGEGEWSFLSDLVVEEHVVMLLSGSLITNGKKVTAQKFHSTGEEIRSLTLADSEIELKGSGEDSWLVSGEAFTLNQESSTISFVGDGAGMINDCSEDINFNMVVFASGSQINSLQNRGDRVTFTNISFEGGAVVSGNHIFGTVSLHKGGQYLFENGSTQIILNGFNGVGDCKDYIVLMGDGGEAIIDSRIDISLYYVNLKDVVVQGVNNYIVNGGIDLGGNEGWLIYPPSSQTFHWTGKQGSDWFNPENWTPECIPTRLDDVIFDNAKGVVNIPSFGRVAECRNMNWNGTSSTTIFIGEGDLNIYGSLDFTDLKSIEYSGKLGFTSVKDETITLGGLELNGESHFIGDNRLSDSENKGSWTFEDSFCSKSDMIVERGVVNTNNKEIRLRAIKSGFSSKRELLLGNSKIYLTVLELSPDNLTFKASGCEFYFIDSGELKISRGTNPIIFNRVFFAEDGLSKVNSRAEELQFEKLTFEGNAYLINGSLTIDTLSLALGKTYRFQEGSTYNLGYLVAKGGCDGFIDLATFSAGEYTLFNSRYGSAINVIGVNLQDIHSNDTGLFVADNSIDLGNNEGWIINKEREGRTLFWVDNGGSWNDPTHWSEFSGGDGGACLPTAVDDVIFDQNSFDVDGQRVEVSSNDIRCRTMDWSGAKHYPCFASYDEPISGIYIFGSLVLTKDMDIEFPQDMNIYFLSNNSGEIIQCGEHLLPNNVIFDGVREGELGEWTLFDDLRMEGDMILDNGAVLVKGNTVECTRLISDNSTSSGRILDIEKSNLIINGYNGEAMRVATFNDDFQEVFILRADSSTIDIKGDGDIFFTGTKAGKVGFNDVVFNDRGQVMASRLSMEFSHLTFRGDGEIFGKNIFDVLEFTPGNSYKLEKGYEFSIKSQLIACGNCNKPIVIESTEKDSASIITPSSEDILLDYVYLKDIHVKDNGGVYHARNSEDGGNTSGWIISGLDPKVLYWVGRGDTQEWNDYENWSTLSGGIGDGCVPTLLDDVVFDRNSFLYSKDVEIIQEAYCHNMLWESGVNAQAMFNVNARLTVAGSMRLNPDVSVNLSESLLFVGDDGSDAKIVDFAGKALDGDVLFEGCNQLWQMESSLITSQGLYLKKGTLNTLGNNVVAGFIESIEFDSFDKRELQLEDSEVVISSSEKGWRSHLVNSSGVQTLSISSKSGSVIKFVNGGILSCSGLGSINVNFGDVIFYDDGVLKMKDVEGIFNNVSFLEEGHVEGNNTFSSLTFTLGYHNTLQAEKTTTINDELYMVGVTCEPVELASDGPGNQTYIKKMFDGGEVVHVRLQDLHILGGSPFNVLGKFEDKGNNIGWIDSTDDDDIDEDTYWGFKDKPHEENCNDVTILDVSDFPVNKNTTYQWFRLDDSIWSKIGEDSSIEVDENGSFRVELRFSEECLLSDDIDVLFSDNPHLSMSLEAFNLKCAGDNSGRIVAEVSGGYEPYQYTWMDEEENDLGNSNNSELNNLSPGKYSVVVSDSDGCMVEDKVTIFDAYPVELNVTDITHNLCFGDNNGSVSLNAEGGTGSYKYYLGDIEYNTPTINHLYGGTYISYVIDDNGCVSGQQTFDIIEPGEIVLDWLSGGLDCFGDSDGSLDPRPQGGAGEFQYNWSGPESFASSQPLLFGLKGGVYMLHLTDQNGCLKEDQYLLSEPDSLKITTPIVKQVDCFGDSTGEVYIEASGGSGGFLYKLGEQENQQGVFQELKAGVYSLEIIDQRGCSEQIGVEVKEPRQLELLLANHLNPSCWGDNTGQLIVNARGGTGGYSFSWMGPNDFRSIYPDISNLEAGSYYLQVQDNNKCLVKENFVMSEPTELQLGVRVKKHVSDFGSQDGVLVIEMMGGEPGYSFICTGPDEFSYSGSVGLNSGCFEIDNLEGGIYTVLMTDTSKCQTLKKRIMIEEPGKLLAYISKVTPVSCNGSNDGALRLQISGVDSNYSVVWYGTQGQTWETDYIYGLAPDRYSFIVTSEVGTVSGDTVITEPNLLDVDIVESEVAFCYGEASGSLELNVSGGTPGYEVLWEGENGFLSHAHRLIQLRAGDYSYTVKDSKGCEAQGVAHVIQADEIRVYVKTFAVSGEGLSDGHLDVEVNGGIPKYSLCVTGAEDYKVDLFLDSAGVFSVGGLKQGTYHIEVKDINGCSLERDVNIIEPGKLIAWVESKTEPECFGNSGGAIDLKVSGGSGDYAYLWSGDGGYSSDLEDPEGLYAGNYHVEVTDKRSFETFEVETKIDQPSSVDALVCVQDVTCNGFNDGYINIHPQGGNSGYHFEWGGNVINRFLEDQDNLISGMYYVIVSDSNNCVSDTIYAEVSEPEPLIAYVNAKEPGCYDWDNGNLRLSPQNGTPPYKCYWEDIGSIMNELSSLKAGVYKYRISDNNGCMMQSIDGDTITYAKIVLNQPDSLVAEISDFQNILCAGNDDGSAKVIVNGGTAFEGEEFDYKYLWSNGQTLYEANDLGSGEYKVLVVDANGCVDSSNIIINEPDPLLLSLEITRPITRGSDDGAISLKVSGGVPEYLFNCQDENLMSPEITGLEAGKYHVKVTDFNDCIVDTTVNLDYLYEERVVVPKVFTPNNDGFNDVWKIKQVEFVDRIKIAVYDRWGKVIYKFEGSGNEYMGTPWDGRDGRRVLPVGSYYYAIVLEDDSPIVGAVTIVR